MLSSRLVRKYPHSLIYKHKVATRSGELLEDAGQYMRLMGKLTYLTVIRPDITFTVQRGEPVFVSTEDYSLACGNKDFEVS